MRHDPIAQLEHLRHDTSLLVPANWRERFTALDTLDALQSHLPPLPLAHAHVLAERLEAANQILFASLREQLRTGSIPALLQSLLDEPSPPSSASRYDATDDLIDGLLSLPASGPSLELAPEMVYYQPTPARHILYLLRLLQLTPQDTLLDIGCGLGRVPLLTALFTPAIATGIEIDPTYVQAANQTACTLNLNRFHCDHANARTADLSHATVFYLYTPFTGTLLAAVLNRLRDEASRRSFRIASFGPITGTLSAEQWLQPSTPLSPDTIAIFRTR